MNNMNPFLAYGEDKRALETVMRLHSVKRWHMIDTTRQQTLAEHSANVALLAFLIAKTAPIEFFDTYAAVTAAALIHDVPEAFTGDIPSHTKRELSGIEELEQRVGATEFQVEVNENTRMLIKLCDLADGIRFIRLHGVDMTAQHARGGLEAQMVKRLQVASEDLNWPQHLLEHVTDNLSFYIYEEG